MENVGCSLINNDYNEDAMVPISNDEEEYVKEDPSVIFKKDLSFICIKCGCLFYFLVYVIFSMSTISIGAGTTTIEDISKPINITTYIALEFLFNVLSICNIVILVYNKYINYKYRNFIYDVSIENIHVLYFIILPFTALVIVYFIFACYANYAQIHDNVLEFITPLVEICFYIATVMLLIDYGGKISTGENYWLKIVNTCALFVTLIGVVGNCLSHLASSAVLSFIKLSHKYLNITYLMDINIKKNNLLSLEIASEPYIIVWGIMVTCYLLAPIMRNVFQTPLTYEMSINSSTYAQIDEVRTGSYNEHEHVSTTSLIIGLLILLISLLEFPLYYALGGSTAQKYSYIFYLIPVPMVILGISAHVYILRTITLWEKVQKRSIIDSTLIWSGFFGQFVFIVALFIESIDKPNNFWSQFSRLIFGFSTLIYTVVQVLVMDLTLVRRPKVHVFYGQLKTFNPIVIIICINLACLLNFLSKMIYYPLDAGKTFSIVLLEGGLRKIGSMFIVVYVMYPIAYFGVMLHSIYF